MVPKRSIKEGFSRNLIAKQLRILRNQLRKVEQLYVKLSNRYDLVLRENHLLRTELRLQEKGHSELRKTDISQKVDCISSSIFRFIRTQIRKIR